MADYYPLIARAIAGLDPSAPGESRRALYERARAALIAQLRSVEPPLSESEITRERLSLEEAVRKVESEAAQRAREASRSTRSDTHRFEGQQFIAQRRASCRTADGARGCVCSRAAPRQPSPPPLPRNDRPPLGQEDRPEQWQARSARQPQVPMQDPQLPPTRERPAARRGADNNAL